MKQRYRIEILDKKTKQKTVFLVNSFSQEVRYQMVPVKMSADQPFEMINAGYENVNINIPFPTIKTILPLKQKKKVVRKKRRKKRKIRKH